MTNFLKALGFFAVITNIVGAQISHPDSSIVERFRNWVDTHRIETRDDHHLAHIFKNWLSNDKFIFETNAKNLTYTVGHNAFSGMSSDEFAEFMGFRANQESMAKGKGFLRGDVPTVEQGDVLDVSALPTSVDWRSKGVVSEVRNQLQCGSCYSFSAVSTLESAVAIKTGKLYDLSEQEIVSCSVKYGNLKCNGGNYDSAWNFVKDNNGICSESDYPYTSGNGDGGSCIKGCTPVSGTKVQSYVSVTPKSDSALMTALTVGPVSISIEADTRSFQLYNSGIYSDFEGCNANSKTKGATSQPNIDHAVVLVGYGTENGQDYYILRNSWDVSWGEGGYMKIARGNQYAPWGVCGVLYDPMYPVV
jgi:cathepsin L